jgi:hypothetical protein
MRSKYFFHFSLSLLAAGLTAAIAQTPLCSTLSSDDALFARASGACRDSASIGDRAPKSVNKAPKSAPTVEQEPRPRPSEAPAAPSSEAPRSAALPTAPSLRAAPAPVERLRLPNVTGVSIKDAQARLGPFKVERREQHDPSPAGRVIEQVPKASTPVARGSAVVLTVSAGPVPAETFELPNVVDRPESAARNSLAEFKIQRVVVASATPVGTVLAQSPDPGSPVSPGAIVVLQISDGSIAAASTPSEPAVAPSKTASTTDDRRSYASPGQITGAAIALALVVGAVLIRRWPRARAIAPLLDSADTASAAPAVITVTAEDFRFAAHLDAGEVRVEFSEQASSQETSDEDSSVHHA